MCVASTAVILAFRYPQWRHHSRHLDYSMYEFNTSSSNSSKNGEGFLGGS